jgi:2-polyprenyl-3-methyl-5-hydroxy-6-metoxy-1,4-benzoquinol methylase
LDLGCGDGYFMEMLRGSGIQSFGVECDPDKAAQVMEKGLHGFQGTFEAFFALAASEPMAYQFDGIFLGHVIEHCRPMDAVQLLHDCVGLLHPGGRIIILTPNIRHSTVQETFWLDISHERPYPKLLLEAMLRGLGCLVESGELENGMEVFAIGTKESLRR